MGTIWRYSGMCNGTGLRKEFLGLIFAHLDMEAHVGPSSGDRSL